MTETPPKASVICGALAAALLMIAVSTAIGTLTQSLLEHVYRSANRLLGLAILAINLAALLLVFAAFHLASRSVALQRASTTLMIAKLAAIVAIVQLLVAFVRDQAATFLIIFANIDTRHGAAAIVANVAIPLVLCALVLFWAARQ